MCDDQGDTRGDTDPGSAGLSRRRLMQGAGLVAAGALAPRLPFRAGAGSSGRLAVTSSSRDVTSDGTAAFSMAMHVHSSFSEQSGSMDAQLAQAATNAVDVLWWTDHDARMESRSYRKTVHFTSLTAEAPAAGEGGAWHWEKLTSGPLASSSTGGIVSSPSSPKDPVVGGAMRVTAKSTSTSRAALGYFANSHPGGDSYKDNLTGQSLLFEVLLASGWARGYLEFLVTTSLHTATAGRPTGIYTLSYRFAPGGTSTRTVSGISGVVTQPLTAGSWSSVTVRPDDDITALWPDMDVRDFQISGITVSAVSTGDTVTGYVDYLRFVRKMSGSAQLTMQRSMEQALAPRYPSVFQRQGLEISKQLPHLNWFGGTVVLPDYSAPGGSNYVSFLRNTVVPQIHSAGGLASYNHPYGFAEGSLLSVAQQDAMLAQVAPVLLSNRALGCDLIEVGYNVRQGVGVAGHIALWDVLSRNALFLTGNGANDDHYGASWRTIVNNFYTSTWATGITESALLASLAAGRSWCAPLGTYGGSMDLLVDGTAPMGSVSVSSVASRRLAITATALPGGSSVQLVQGPVDYAGTADATPGTHVVASVPASELSSGPVSRTVDTSSSSFARTQVVSSAGTIIGVSNPVWLLRSAPPGGIPAPRAA